MLTTIKNTCLIKQPSIQKNNRGQELLLAIIYHKGRVFVVSSENELNKLYQMPVLVRINHFIDYKTNHLRKCLGSYLVRVGKSLNK